MSVWVIAKIAKAFWNFFLSSSGNSVTSKNWNFFRILAHDVTTLETNTRGTSSIDFSAWCGCFAEDIRLLVTVFTICSLRAETPAMLGWPARQMLPRRLVRLMFQHGLGSYTKQFSRWALTLLCHIPCATSRDFF